MILLDPLAQPVIGHRGNRAYAPEDTIPSLLEAVALGVDAVEFDLHVSADGHLVMIHDPTLDRTTSGSGSVRAFDVQTLRGFDAGYRFTRDNGRTYPWRGRGASIATFNEVIDALPADLPLIIELKTAAAAIPLRDAIAHHQLASRVIVAGFDAHIVAPLRGAGFALGASTSEVVRCLPKALLRQQQSPSFDALCIPPSHRGIPVPIGALVRSLRTAGTVTHVWTINDTAQAERLWQAGVNGIISDDPAAMLAARRASRIK